MKLRINTKNLAFKMKEWGQDQANYAELKI